MEKYVLITGGSKGIGLEIAKLFAHDKHNLILIARSQNELNEAAQLLRDEYDVTVDVYAADLSQPESVSNIIEHIKANNYSIETLVNNAGFGGYGNFYERELKNDLDMIQVNVTSLVELTHRLLPDMVKSQSGMIINIASTAAFLPGPLMAVYYATKAFVLSFSVAIREELKGTGVTVTAVCPGPTKTEFIERASMNDSSLFKNASLMTASEVAHIAYKDAQRGNSISITGFSNKMLIFFVRFLPRAFTAGMIKRLQQK